MTKRKTIITVVAAFIAVCAAGVLFLFLHMDVHAGLLMYGGQSQVTIKPANDTHANTFTATINGHTVSETETYLYNESSAGDIVITPAHGYRFKNVSLETDQGAIYVWNSDTPCTQEDLDQEKYDATIETSFTSADLRNLFFAKNPDGSYNYNGALTLSKSFLATDPHVGWKKGEPILIPRESTSAQLEEIGIISIIVETEYIPVNHVELKERHGPDFTEYKFQDHVYTTITALEQAVNTAIDNHQVLAGDEITIGYTTEVLGLSLYSYPEYDALLSVSREEAKIRILGEHELTIFFIYPRGSRGIIVPIHVEPIDPDVPPVSIPTEEFFGSYVNSITVTSNDGHDKTTVYSYDTLNSYLESLYTGTVVDISFDFQPGVIIKEASVGTISEGNTIKGVTLNGPEPVWKDTGEGRVLSGTWSGTLVDGDDGDDAHFEFGTVEWNQDYTEGTQTELSLTIASPPDPQVGLLSLRASTLDSEKTGIVAVAYVYTPQGVTLESGAKITISGSLNNTTNPNAEQEALKTLPEAIYDVDEEENYCGYWFSPDNGVDFKYFYSFTIKAVLTVGDVREEREITVEIEGSESSR